MLFNSPEFIVFFLLVYCLYALLPFRLQNYALLVASYVFYGWWDVRFLFLIALSTTVDFWIGLFMDRGYLTRNQRFIPALFFTIAAVVLLGFDFGSWSHLSRREVGQFDLTLSPIIVWALAGSAGFLALSFLVYAILQRCEEATRRFICVMISIFTQIGLLSFFKYFNFFVDSFQTALNSIGIQVSTWHLAIVLPVGISFYTFQSLSYTIDIYRRQTKPTDQFSVFALFVAYFPQLQAGPIERARHLIPVFANPRALNFDQSTRGLYLIVLGFFKKVGIADGIAPVVDQVFNSSGRISWIDVIAGSAFFAIQIYCDFSGYTDIARGISKLLGINLMVNFNLPYFASNPQDFWRRWHISLSTWLRDYLYVPLGGSRGDIYFVCRNLMLTMVIGGLWHGAAWNFVLWGVYQGSLLCGYRIWREFRPKQIPLLEHSIAHMASIGVFFIFVCYGWLLFRAQSLAQIGHFTSLLISDFGNIDYGAGAPRFSAILGIALLSLMEFTQYWTGNSCYYQKIGRPLHGFIIACMIAIILMGMSNDPAQFIYFQF
jgi:alginate O-acetyltransferase complex protein AlgI